MAVSNRKVRIPDIKRESKIREAIEPAAFYGTKPSWRFSLCDSEQWSLLHDKDLFLNEALERMKELERQSWSDILIAGKKQNHSIPTNELNKVAKDRMQELYLDYDLIYSLRVTGNHRLYGLIDNGAFYILWYDTDHGDNNTCVCRSRLKHT